MMRELIDEDKQQLLVDFEAAGLSEVQRACSNPGTSTLFGVPEYDGVRALAKDWIAGRLEADRLRQCRNDHLLKIGATAAVVAAVFSFFGLFRRS